MLSRLPSVAFLPIFLWLANSPPTAAAEESTISVFLPNYKAKWWQDMHASIISKDDEKTAYTVFCPTQTPQRCNLAGDLPFTFTEGPSTLIFHGTVPNTYVINLECDLEEQTAARCSGYSSFKSGYTYGKYTGPTEVTWTSTFTGTQVVWAVITLTDKIEVQTNGLIDLTATAMETPDSSITVSEIAPHPFPSDDSIFPQQTGTPGESGASGWRRTGEGRWAVITSLAATLLAAGLAL